MRPKKRIVLIDHDEQRRSVLAFTLRTAGWAVDPGCDARSVILAPIPHVLVVAAPFEPKSVGELIGRYRNCRSETGMIVLADDLRKVPHGFGVNFSLRGHSDPIGILATCKWLARRKRGLRKMLPAVAGAMAEAVSA